MSAIAKLERAKKHLRDLDALLKEYASSNPLLALQEEEKESGDLVYRVRIIKPVPSTEIALIVGDLVHNLHSALDLRVCELVRENGNSIVRDNAFPMSENLQDFQTLFSRRLQGLSSHHINIVTNLKPYKEGNEILWELHHLDILDKHKSLIVADSVSQALVIDAAEPFRKNRPKWMDWPAPESMFIAIRPASPTKEDFPIKDGDEIYRIKKEARNGGVDENPKLIFGVGYSDGKDIYEASLETKVKNMVKEVERVLNELQ